MRIVLLCADPRAALGGTGRACVRVRAWADALHRAGHTVDAVVPQGGAPENRTEILEQGLSWRPLRVPVATREIDWHLSRVQPDLVIELLARDAPEGALAATDAGVPHLYLVDEPLLDVSEAPAKAAQSRSAFAWGFMASGGAVVASQSGAEWVRRLAPAGFPLVVSPPGARPEFFEPPPAHVVAALGQRMRVAAGEFRIGLVGAVGPGLDSDALARAAGSLERPHGARLLVAGHGPQVNELLRAAFTHGARVTMVGQLDDDHLPAFFSLCDAVFVPAARDGRISTRTIVEAMAASRPVVAHASDTHESVITDGRDGLIAPPADPSAAGTALRRLASDPALRGRLGAEARRTIEHSHTWDAAVARTLAFACDGLRSTSPMRERANARA